MRLQSWDRQANRTGFAGFAEADAEGLCYPWAFEYVMKHPDATLCQGTTVIPLHKPETKIGHAWVTHRGKVMDWQTMEAGYGGNWRGRGYPEDIFHRLYKPTNVRCYDKEQALIAMAKSRGGLETGGSHYGPWHGKGSRGKRKRK
jgi:hypothetical protein